MASPLRTLAWLPLAALLLAPLLIGSAKAQTADSATALRERHAQLAAQMENTPFQRPVVLQSSETGDQLQGSIDAVVAQPFAVAREHLQRPAALCEILMLQINTKQCTVAGNVLDVRIGRKHDQPLADAYRVAFSVQPQASSTDYMNLRLGADTGPFSTRDYRMQLQAIPIEGGSKTFLHLHYSYGIGLTARLAMQGYLATLGAGKVGFTRTGSTGYIGGMRGAVERNTMRYYLAIDAYLASLAAPPAQQRAQRLETWFAATEQYARQLHELDRADYLTMKQNEFRRLSGSI
ncbi:MAG: hypothetical protein H7Y33_11685 [Cytophagales bacterium]|nr:hypothetical protein [Rhizobacter sp.]